MTAPSREIVAYAVELADRLERASESLASSQDKAEKDLVRWGGFGLEARRLSAKREGVDLAASYVEETLRDAELCHWCPNPATTDVEDQPACNGCAEGHDRAGDESVEWVDG